MNAGIAQLVEQRFRKAWVVSSSLISGSNFKSPVNQRFTGFFHSVKTCAFLTKCKNARKYLRVASTLQQIVIRPKCYVYNKLISVGLTLDSIKEPTAVDGI